MENMVKSMKFWEGKNVLVTGYTGFKGSWLCLWLKKLGANVSGFALEPPTEPNLHTLGNVAKGMDCIKCDIRDLIGLKQAIKRIKPEIIFHMAAQPLVLKSYRDPVETFSTNIMGTVNLLEATRDCDSVRSVVNITSDKCYENKEWVWGYRENDAMGGIDPYSCSKACSELITNSFRMSFFNEGRTVIASARAGNVIGGGDWAENRIVPDIVRAVMGKGCVKIRNPMALRPWQYVLEPLYGYLLLAQKMYENGQSYGGAWNFGPSDDSIVPVKELAAKILECWGEGKDCIQYDTGMHPHEANCLKLDCSKARNVLGWKPTLSINESIEWTANWYKAFANGDNVERVTYGQIEEFESLIDSTN